MNKVDSLKSILEYSMKYVPFYKKYNWEIENNQSNSEDILSNIPLLEKNDALLNVNDLISEEYYTYQKKQKMVNRRTSGSTGKSLKIFWDADDDKRSMMPLWFHRKKYYNISPQDKLCYFFSFDFESSGIKKDDIFLDESGLSIGINKNILCTNKIEDACNRLIEFQPKWMIAQPSICILVAEWFEKNKISLAGLDYIELTGEMVTSSVLEKIIKTFKCKVANQYGCNEANSIAYECPEGNLHCMNSNVVVEILNDKQGKCNFNEDGNIYLTTLHNRCMPFIRYGIGDRGKLVESNCKCGNKSPIIKLATGRNTEFIRYRDGSKESVYVFLKPVEIINDKFGNVILQFQIIQKDYELFIINVVLNEKFSNWKESVEELYYDFLDINGKENKKFIFKFFNQMLPDEKSGKLRNFICEV